jgi:hypothetical protein
MIIFHLPQMVNENCQMKNGKWPGFSPFLGIALAIALAVDAG